MLITNHVLSGAIVGLLAPNEGTAFAAGFVSHFVLDAIPHFGSGLTETSFKVVAVTDGLVGLGTMGVVLYMTAPGDRKKVLSGMVGACLPDTDKPNRMFFGSTYHPRWFRKFHGAMQKEHSHLAQEFISAGVLGSVFTTLTARRWNKVANERLTATFE